MAFGLTSTRLCHWLKFGRRILLCSVQNHDDAKVRLPSNQQINTHKGAIQSKYPVLHEVWGACDGLKLPTEAVGNYRLQSWYYNGWTCGHCISMVLVFAPDRKICICVLNCPGSWHDSTIADYGVYDKMKAVYLRTGGKVVVDQAFRLHEKDYLIQSAQQDPIGDPLAVLRNRAATSVRHLLEWGMRTIQAQFPRVKDPMKYEEQGERQIVLTLLVYLYNFQSSWVGINQILNSFMLETEEMQTFYGHMLTADADKRHFYGHSTDSHML